LDRSGMFTARKLQNGLYDFQQAAVEQITQYNDKHGSIVVIGTGLGKTHVMATSVCNIGLPTGISVPSGLVRQTCRVLQNLMTGWIVVPVESHASLVSPQPKVVLVVSHALLKTHSTLMTFLSNPVVMIDESHMLKETMLTNIWRAKPDRTCIHFLTATPASDVSGLREDLRIFKNLSGSSRRRLPIPEDSIARMFLIKKTSRLQNLLGLPKQIVVAMLMENPLDNYWEALVDNLSRLSLTEWFEAVVHLPRSPKIETLIVSKLQMIVTNQRLDPDRILCRSMSHLKYLYSDICENILQELKIYRAAKSEPNMQMFHSVVKNLSTAHQMISIVRPERLPKLKAFDRLLLRSHSDKTYFQSFGTTDVIRMSTSMSSKQRDDVINIFKKQTSWSLFTRHVEKDSFPGASVFRLLIRCVKLIDYVDVGQILLVDRSGSLGWNLHTSITHLHSESFIPDKSDLLQFTGRVNRIGAKKSAKLAMPVFMNSVESLILDSMKIAHANELEFEEEF
jgi:hypothetical protein